MTRRFWKDCAGVFGIILGLAAVPMIVAMGAGIDFGRAYLLQTRLSGALDAAGLAVGSSPPDGDLEAVFRNYFRANFPDDRFGAATQLSVNIEGDEITLSARASVETVFLKIVNQNELNVIAQSTIVRDRRDLEIVLVLDNTGSMRSRNKIGALRVAAQDLVDILFRDETTPDNLRMGLVPFVTTVNIGNGPGIRRFVRFPAPNHDFSADPVGWKGCVEARPQPFDVLDAYVPNDPQRGEWTPYFWEAETTYRFRRSNSSCQNRWWFPRRTPNTIPPLPRPTGRSGDPPFPRDNTLGFAIDTTPPFTRGPNKACPQPLTPLTNNRGELERAIAQMTPWSGNGTMVNLGAVWGWRVLSPEAPFGEGAPFRDVPERVVKVMIILTDGVNFFSGVSGRCTRTNPRYNSQYTGYGYASERRLGTTDRAAARFQLDDRLREVCANIKRRRIIVYTITFQLNDSRTQSLFRDCASEREKYFNSPSNEELREAFRAIGSELSNLRVAR